MTDGPRRWSRLEPRARDEEDLPGLRAEVQDPLWMLGRQWQVGELDGEDGGSPVRVDLWVDHDRVSRYDAGNGPVDYDPKDRPLEALVERETVVSGTGRDRPDVGVAVEAGQHFLRLLDRNDYPAPDTSLSGSDFAGEYVLDESDYEHGADVPEDAASRRFGMVVGGRALDGYEVFRALEANASNLLSAGGWKGVSWPGAGPLPAPHGVTDGYRRAAKAFADWYADQYEEPGQEGDAWNPERLEYEFDVATGDPDTETVYSASEYPGGHLDWSDFDSTSGSLYPNRKGKGGSSGSKPVTESDVRGKSVSYESDPKSATPGPGLTAVQSPDVSAMPTSVRYPGMPRSRWWEFEDGGANLFGADVGPGEVGKELTVDFAVTYGEDWFSVPVETPVGSTQRITALAVVDTFGAMEVADPTQEVTGEWNLFTDELPGHDEPGLFLPPSLGEGFQSDPVESVTFARDELANLAWAIESKVRDPYGTTIDRREFADAELEIARVNTASDPANEYVELTNVGDEPLEIGGWELSVHLAGSGGEKTYAFGKKPGDVVVGPDEAVRVVTDTGNDTDRRRYWQPGYSGTLLSDAARVVVRNRSGWPVAVHQFGDPGSGLDPYRLASDVREFWFPLQPKSTASGFRMADTEFLLARLLDADVGVLPAPLGQVLDPYVPEKSGQGRVERIHDEELTGAGVEVVRRFQLSRWIGGSNHLWAGKRASTGRGGADSGLCYDYLDEE